MRETNPLMAGEIEIKGYDSLLVFLFWLDPSAGRVSHVLKRIQKQARGLRVDSCIKLLNI